MLQLVARLIMSKRNLGIARILESASECEMEIDPVGRGERTGLQKLLHPIDVGALQRTRFQIGKAPPGVAGCRIESEGASISRHAFVGASDGLQHMAVSGPQYGVAI